MILLSASESDVVKSAPGRHYREGISLLDLFDLFPNETAAEAWFEQERWGDRVCFAPAVAAATR